MGFIKEWAEKRGITTKEAKRQIMSIIMKAAAGAYKLFKRDLGIEGRAPRKLYGKVLKYTIKEAWSQLKAGTIPTPESVHAGVLEKYPGVLDEFRAVLASA